MAESARVFFARTEVGASAHRHGLRGMVVEPGTRATTLRERAAVGAGCPAIRRGTRGKSVFVPAAYRGIAGECRRYRACGDCGSECSAVDDGAPEQGPGVSGGGGGRPGEKVQHLRPE